MTSRVSHFFLAAALAVTTSAGAQTGVDPSGHWEGSISAPFGEVPIAIDITRRDGQIVATYSRPDGSLSGFPLSDIEVNGSDVKLALNANGGGVFRGTIAAARMTGTFAAFAGTVPFALTRTGEARMAAPLVSPSISKTLEGAWTGGFTVGGDNFRVRMTLKNEAGGTALGTVVRLDDRDIQLPVQIREEGAQVTITIPAAGSSFAGTLNPAGTEIVGNYIERDLKVPLMFVRVPE
jgi:hypothetical protein